MTTSSWYASQSKHNQEISNKINTISSTEYVDWEITTLFYSALHIINEYFFQHGITLPNKHEQRAHLIRTTLKPIYSEYQELFMLSIRTRYLVRYNSIKPQEVQDARNHFDRISCYVRSII